MTQHDEQHVQNPIPATPGQAEGSPETDEQSQGHIAPQQTDQAEGEEQDATK